MIRNFYHLRWNESRLTSLLVKHLDNGDIQTNQVVTDLGVCRFFSRDLTGYLGREKDGVKENERQGENVAQLVPCIHGVRVTVQHCSYRMLGAQRRKHMCVEEREQIHTKQHSSPHLLVMMSMLFCCLVVLCRDCGVYGVPFHLSPTSLVFGFYWIPGRPLAS